MDKDTKKLAFLLMFAFTFFVALLVAFLSTSFAEEGVRKGYIEFAPWLVVAVIIFMFGLFRYIKNDVFFINLRKLLKLRHSQSQEEYLVYTQKLDKVFVNKFTKISLYVLFALTVSILAYQSVHAQLNFSVIMFHGKDYYPIYVSDILLGLWIIWAALHTLVDSLYKSQVLIEKDPR